MRKVMAVLGLSVVLLGACGGDSGDDDSNTDIASGTTLASVTTGGGASAGDFGAFCAARAGITPPSAPPAASDIKSSIDSAADALNKAAENAPAEIRADVRIVADAYKKFIDAVKAANYDFSKADPAELQAISTPAVQAAGARITEWAASHCK